MQAEVLTHFPHAESPRCIVCPNRIIPLRVLLSVPNYRFGYARNKTSYLDSADVQTDTFSDETAGPGEADKTLGAIACGSDKSVGSLSRSSISKGNLGRAASPEPGCEEVHDE